MLREEKSTWTKVLLKKMWLEAPAAPKISRHLFDKNFTRIALQEHHTNVRNVILSKLPFGKLANVAIFLFSQISPGLKPCRACLEQEVT